MTDKKNLNETLKVDEQKLQYMSEVKARYLKGELTLEEAKQAIESKIQEITPQEFAAGEQMLQAYGIGDDVLAERMEELLELVKDIMVPSALNVEKGHPIYTYMEEVKAIRGVLSQMKALLDRKFIKNEWLACYDDLNQIKIHFSRKQNQLYPYLEKKGFDKPSKVMWTLENNIKKSLNECRDLLESDQDALFIEKQAEIMTLVEDMMVKEEDVLFPTALDLITEEEFQTIQAGDSEIGYCLIDPPKLRQDRVALATTKDNTFKVSQGELTLEQINLIYKHLKVDLSYVDEQDIVRFYSDTKHRVFPRSPGVIGREVHNCHPRESVEMVEAIITAFKNGEQDEAEFWLEMGGKFIYIVYTAVRDDAGQFKGVLEMMQDVTHIRSLEGSQRLLSWRTNIPMNTYGITKDTVIGDVIKKYPSVKSFLISLSPKFEKLKNPLLFKTMSSMATFEMVAQRGEIEVEHLIDEIIKHIATSQDL